MPFSVSGHALQHYISKPALSKVKKIETFNVLHTFSLGTWRASADNARLYFEDDQSSRRIGAWCASERDNQWLQVVLGETKRIRAIATQGEQNNWNYP